MLQLYIHAAVILCLALLFSSFLTYASLLLLSAFLIFASATLFLSGCELFSVLLLFCETHVVFMLVCLALSWVKFDCQQVSSLSSENRYLILPFVFVGSLPMLLFVFSDSTALTIGTRFAGVAAASNFFLYSVISYATTIAQYVSAVFFIVSSFEFVIINVFMLLAVIVFIAIQKYINGVKYNSALSGLSRLMLNSLIFGYILRAQRQQQQLLKSMSICLMSKGEKLNAWYKGSRVFKKLMEKLATKVN